MVSYISWAAMSLPFSSCPIVSDMDSLIWGGGWTHLLTFVVFWYNEFWIFEVVLDFCMFIYLVILLEHFELLDFLIN